MPRVYQRFYEAAFQKINLYPGPLKALLMHALTTEIKIVQGGQRSAWGKFLGLSLGGAIHGGKVRVMISGAAPLPLHVHEFLVAACGCHVLQGYGMTENCANATLEMLGDNRAGHVGPPMPTVQVKLEDVPEMNYTTAENNSGEVCTSGLSHTCPSHAPLHLCPLLITCYVHCVCYRCAPRAWSTLVATIRTRRRRTRFSTPTVGCTRATSANGTPTARSRSSTVRRTSSS